MIAKAVPTPPIASARPLRLIVTRPAAQAAHAVADLASRGVDAVAVPLIQVLPIADTGPIAALWSALPTHRLVVFVSANAVLHFFAARPAGL
ncbi:MAG: uroporphyrinogen-III synthase, partial [Pseudomonadota bacterium]|nr:uroporphyrinogen-III synthase [Pseudomonadota bacterium]